MSERTYPVRTTDGRTLSVREVGAPHGPVVFVLHGTPMSNRLYAPHVEDARRRGIRLIAYDRPGYGGSTPRPGRTIADAADDVRTIADQLGVDRFGVWGISGGGPHALACGAKLSGRARAVVALASPAPYDAKGLDYLADTGEANIEETRASLLGAEALEAVIGPQRESYVRGDRAATDAAMATLLSPVDRAVYFGGLGEYLFDGARAGLVPGVAGWRDDDIAFVRPWGFAPKEIRVPVTLWQGRQDRFVPYSHGKWLGEEIGHAVRNLSDEDGHLTLYEHRIPSVHSWLLTYLGR